MNKFKENLEMFFRNAEKWRWLGIFVLMLNIENYQKNVVS